MSFVVHLCQILVHVESSRILSFEAIHDVLNALGTLSLSSLANAAATENFHSQADLPSRKDSRSQAATAVRACRNC